ncbi:MAG: hypothetical protein AB2708_09020, partial [Candidatus Thiodiazotropha taylori]
RPRNSRFTELGVDYPVCREPILTALELPRLDQWLRQNFRLAMLNQRKLGGERRKYRQLEVTYISFS